MTTEFKLSLHSKMIQEGSTPRDSGLGNSGQISGNKRWYCCCGCSHVADILNIQLPYCPAFNPVLMEASLSRESAVTGTEICEENSNAILRRRQYFILALDAWGIALCNMHTWLRMLHLFLGQDIHVHQKIVTFLNFLLRAQNPNLPLQAIIEPLKRAGPTCY